MRFEITMQGEKLVRTQFTRMANAADHSRPAFNNVVDYLFKINEQQFESQGRRGGGSWRKLTTKWAQRKQRQGQDIRILHQSHTLRRSVTRRRARGQILEFTPTSVTLGTRLPYAGRHQRERPFLVTTATDRENMRNLIRDHLMEVWGGGRRAKV